MIIIFIMIIIMVGFIIIIIAKFNTKVNKESFYHCQRKLNYKQVIIFIVIYHESMQKLANQLVEMTNPDAM